VTINTAKVVIGVREYKIRLQVLTFALLQEVEDSSRNWKKKKMEAITAIVMLTLVTVATPAISDNVTDAGFDYNVSMTSRPSRSRPSRPSYSSPYYVSPTLSYIFRVATITIAVVGFLANGYVLLAMLFSKKSSSNNINAFITHQTILDLIACIFLILGYLLSPTTKMSYALAFFMCLAFRSFAVSLTSGNASICGLVIITIERYVKIVHPVAHRNHYRSWMTLVGIVIPWIFGIFLGLIPTWTTAKVVRGRCRKDHLGSTYELQLTWSVAKFILLYLGPLAVFVFGYWKILGVIRRQRKQVGHSQAQGTSEAAKAAEKANRRKEMNIIKTMVLVSVSFAVCFVCMRSYAVLTHFRVAPSAGAFFSLFSVFSYASRCLNPFIYATQYEVVRNWWKVMVCRVIRRQRVEEATQVMSAAPDTSERHQNKATGAHVTTRHL